MLKWAVLIAVVLLATGHIGLLGACVICCIGVIID